MWASLFFGCLFWPKCVQAWVKQVRFYIQLSSK